jgi:hypothetical protein
MRFQGVTSLLVLTLLLVGCNEDVPSRKAIKQTPQPIVTETVTVYSGIHREIGSKPITYKSEIGVNSDSPKIRAIPDIRFDDEGGDERNVTTRTFKVRPDKLCGADAKAILSAKIADCLAQNGDKSVWDGTINAGSAESEWVLVTLSEKENGESFEIWLDKRAGMLWSGLIAIEGNWCAASGSQLQTSDHVGEPCEITGKGQSLCTKYAPTQLPGVRWRLPTRHDFLQADIDGVRFVLDGDTNTLWTATTSTDVKARDKAWTYNMQNGTLVAELMNSTRNVRCIGTPNF